MPNLSTENLTVKCGRFRKQQQPSTVRWHVYDKTTVSTRSKRMLEERLSDDNHACIQSLIVDHTEKESFADMSAGTLPF